MPSLLSNAQIARLSGNAYDHFLTFAKPITIHKEAAVTYNTVSDPAFFGYNQPNQGEPTYTPVYAQFSGIKVGPGSRGSIDFNTANQSFSDNKTYLKVLYPCHQYIEFGKTEKVDINGIVYNLDSEVTIQDCWGLYFYVYEIKQTN